MSEPERLDRHRTVLIAYDVCRRALAPPDPARRATMRPVLEAWMQLIAVARAAGVPVIYTTPAAAPMGPTWSCCRRTFPRRPACHR